MKKEDDHNTTDKRKEYGTEDRYSSEPQQAHLTGELVIVAKFGGHSFSLLACECSQAGRQTKNLVLAIFKNLYLSFYKCCIVLCPISGFSNVTAV